jgi:hypothetical protein
VEVKNVILDDLRQSPYSARIEFVKIFTNPSDHTELRREQWTASVTSAVSRTGGTRGCSASCSLALAQPRSLSQCDP